MINWRKLWQWFIDVHDRNYLEAAVVLSLILTGILAICVYKSSLLEAVIALDKETRIGFYTVVCSITGALLGFTITGITILFALSGNEKLGLLKKNPYYTDIYRAFFNAIYVLAITIIISLLSLLYDRSENPKSVFFFLAIGMSILTILTLYRCVWILKRVIGIVNKAPKQPGQ